MADYDIGTAFLTASISFRGVAEAVEAEAARDGRLYAQTFSDYAQRSLSRLSLGPSDSDSARQGQQSAGKFADGFKTKVTAALKALPDVEISADSSDADVKIARLREELLELSRQHIGVDIGEVEAIQQIDRIKAELAALGAESPSVSIKTNTAEATRQLDDLRAEIDRVANSDPDVTVRANTGDADTRLAATRASVDDLGSNPVSVAIDVITGPAISAIGFIKTALLDLSKAAVITPLVAGGASLLGPLAAVVGGGAGVGAASLPGLTAVKDALSAQSAAQKATATSAGQSATAQVSAANQIKGAQLSLADTERRVANDRITAAQSVKTARLGVAQAEQQATQGVAQADAQVTAAERTLADAQAASLTAQKALTDARNAATRSLQDQAFASQDASLQLQQDQLSLTEAQQNQASVDADAVSTDLQRQEAALAVAQAQQALTEQQVTATRATQDNNAAQAAGVAGSPQVVAAQSAITQSATAQKTAQQQLTDAKTAQAKAVSDGNAKIATAEQALANARRAAALQQAQDADDLTRAQLAVTQAQIGANSSVASGSTTAAAYGLALANLTPPEQALLSATQSLKTAFGDFGRSLEPATLPLFTNGLQILTGLLPKLEPLIHATAAALNQIETSFGNAVKGPGFTSFLDTLTKLVGPALHDIAGIGGNLASVFGHVVKAFAPLSGTVLDGLKQLTGELAKASASPAVKQFVAEMVKLGPSVISAFSAVGGAVGTIVKALAPLAGPVLSVITTLAKALSGIVTQVGPSITALFKTLAPVINTLITALAPVVTMVVKTLAPVIGSVVKTLAPVLGTLVTALAKGFVALAPAIGPIAKLVGTVVTALSPVLPLIGRLIGELLPPLAALFTRIVVAIEPFIGQLVSALGPVIPQIAVAFGQFLTALTPLLPTLAQVLVSLVPLIPPLAELIVQILKLAVQLLPVLIPLFKLLPPIIQFLTSVINFVVQAITDLVKWISDAIGWLKDFGKHASDAASAVSGAWNSAWSAIKTAWTDARDFLTGEWSKFEKTAGSLWKNIAGAITGAFGAVKGFFSGMWADVETVFANGVNFVTQKILNPLVGILNDVLGVFGVKIGKIGKISVPGASSGVSGSSGPTGGRGDAGYALGGVLPGYTPGTDGIHLPQYHFSGGEGILVPEATRALGGISGIQAINSMFTARVSPPNYFAGGGTIPGGGNIGGQVVDTLGSFLGGLGEGAVSTISGAVGKIKDAIRQGAADAAIAALKVAESPIQALLGTGGTPIANQLASGVFTKLNSAVYDYIGGHVKAPAAGGSGPAGSGGAIPVGQHLALIQQALGLAGVADTSANERAVNIIVDYESGWNPTAINLTDSNAAAGHPSQGLMQTIPGTFEAYRLKSLPDVITDPLANLVAGIRYAVSRYGSLQTQGVNNIESGQGGYVGYDNGGFLPPGLTTVFNGTGRPEPVFTAAQFDQMSSGGTGSFEGNLYLDSGEFLGKVRGEAHSVVDSRLATATERARRGVPGGALTQLQR